VLGRLLFRLEWFARDRAPLSRIGAQLLVVLRKTK
jgi:hypothetical protein